MAVTPSRLAWLFSLSASLAAAQGVGTPDVHPQITTQKCTTAGGCVTLQTSLVLDSGSHSLTEKNSSTSCYGAGGALNKALCPDAATCAQNCVLEAADYAQHGVSTEGDSMTLHMYLDNNGSVTAASPRVYLLDESGEQYEMLSLLNQELAFDVDLSTLVCGMNGALYFSEMNATGGQSALNPAGAAYGTGYCDAQCPVQTFINGVLNTNSAGACCNEMDIWEANARATAFTPHSCNQTGLYECTGSLCGSNGVCDESGCGYNSYAVGDPDFYGYNKTVDTNKPFTVVTQFITDTGNSTGVLTEIRRLYVQDGVVIANAAAQAPNLYGNSITQARCDETAPVFTELGGLQEMGQAIGRGMVLIFSIWNDNGQFMNWLDSGSAGPCNATEGNPALIEANEPQTSVTFSNIKWGDLNSTYAGTPAS